MVQLPAYSKLVLATAETSTLFIPTMLRLLIAFCNECAATLYGMSVLVPILTGIPPIESVKVPLMSGE